MGQSKRNTFFCLFVMVVFGGWVDTSLADKGSGIVFRPGLVETEHDRVILEGFVNHAVAYAEGLTAEKVEAQCKKSPEMFAWVEFKYLNCLNVAYELTGDTKYLDLLKDRFELFREVMSAEHDEYLGWYGKTLPNRQPKDNPDLLIDEMQMNFRAIWMLSNWIEQARTDEAYATANEETIKSYLLLMKGHLYPKWDARGRFAEIPGRGGVYHGLDFPIDGLPTLSHEKLSIMVDGLLALYRVTGDKQYMRRALQVGTWYKSCLTLKDGHYEWMSWAGAGEWDVSTEKEDSWKVSWIAPDPNAPWYVTSMSIALNLYQHGLLFEDEDIARFVKTQKEMCWNGDMENPVYRSVSGDTGKWVKGRFLSYQLAPYDAVIEELAFDGPHEAEAEANASSSWKGCANAQDYVREKYLMREVVKGNPQPYGKYGKQFLEDMGNMAFYDFHYFKVTGTGAKAALKPSEMFGEEGEE